MAEGGNTAGGEMPTPDIDVTQGLEQSASEGQQTPEQQEGLAKAAHTVADLYLGDKLSGASMLQAGVRDEVWAEEAQELGIFSDKARELREAMKVVAEARKSYPPTIEVVYGMPFANITDELARAYLGDVLTSRAIADNGRLNGKIDVVTESKAMAAEMGIKEGWRSEQAKGVTLDKAMAATLEGKMRMKHQPNHPAAPMNMPPQPGI